MPKYLFVKQLITDRLRDMAEGEALPTMAGLQVDYGVSLGTVNRAIRELDTEGLVDVRQGSGIYATGYQRTLQIAICFPYDVLSPEAGAYPRLLLGGLGHRESALRDVTCRHYFHAGSGLHWHDKYDLLKQDIRAHMVDAVIGIGMYSPQLGDLHVPVVGLHNLPHVTSRVLLDYVDLVRQSVRLLAARGCRRLAYVGSHHDQLPAEDDSTYTVATEHEDARRAFLAEVKRLGLETAPPWIQGVHDQGGKTVTKTQAAGERAIEQMAIAAGLAPDGIVSTDDHLSHGICRALQRAGLAVGRDIQLASHANSGDSALDPHTVHLLEFDPDEVAHALLQTARDLAAGHQDVPPFTHIKAKVADTCPPHTQTP